MMVSALDLKTKELKQIPLAIIPEKCVWSKKEANEVFCAIPKFIEKGTYPDDWYKGIISFEDNLLKINLSTLKTSSFSLTDPIDAMWLLLPEDESKIFFTNKKDGSIWKADLRYRLTNLYEYPNCKFFSLFVNSYFIRTFATYLPSNGFMITLRLGSFPIDSVTMSGYSVRTAWTILLS